jgi:hypothetical protein
MNFVTPPVQEQFVSLVCAHLSFYSPGRFDNVLAAVLLLRSVSDKSKADRYIVSSVQKITSDILRTGNSIDIGKLTEIIDPLLTTFVPVHYKVLGTIAAQFVSQELIDFLGRIPDLVLAQTSPILEDFLNELGPSEGTGRELLPVEKLVLGGESVFPEEVIQTVQCVSLLFQADTSPKYIGAFFERLRELEGATAFLLRLAAGDQIPLGSEFVGNLYSPLLFDASQSIFYERINPKIAVLRQTVIQILFENPFGNKELFFRQIWDSPVLFVEMLFRLKGCELAALHNELFLSKVLDALPDSEMLRGVCGDFLIDILHRSAIGESYSSEFANKLFEFVREPSFCVRLDSKLAANLVTFLAFCGPSDELTGFVQSLIGTHVHKPDSWVLDRMLFFIECHPSSLVVYQMIEFLGRLAVSSDFCVRFFVAVRKIDCNVPEKIVLSLLFKPRGRSALLEESNVSFIRDPSVLPFILAVFGFKNRYRDLFDALDRLCDFSMLNRFQLHESEFDLCLLALVKSFPEDVHYRGFEFPGLKSEEEVDHLTKLFKKIAAARCSVVVAYQVLHLLFHHNRNMFDQTMCSYQFSMGVKKVYCENPISCSAFLAGSTIILRLFVDEHLADDLNCVVSLIRFGEYFEIGISNTSLHCRTASDDIYLSGTQNWNTFFFEFKGHSDGLCLTFCRNQEKCAPVEIPVQIDSDFTLSLGNVNTIEADEPELLAVYQFSDFYYLETIVNESNRASFCANLVPETRPTISFPSDNMTHAISNLFAVLRTDFPIETIVPFFDLLGLFPDPASLVRVLILLLGTRTAELIHVIALLLTKCSPEILTFELYDSFYSWFDLVNDKFSLFQNILFNFGIWMRAGGSAVVPIVRHWVTHLQPRCEEFFRKSRFVVTFLAKIRRCLYFTKSDDIAKDFARSSDLDLEQILAFLFAILAELGPKSMSTSDFVSLIEHGLCCKDLDQVLLILRWCFRLLTIVKVRPDVQDLLQCFDIITFPQLISPLLKLLREVAPENLYFQAMLLLYSFPLNVDFSSTFGDLRDGPELLPICSMMAIRLGHDDQSQIADFLLALVRAKLEIGKLQNWFLWPILFALQTSEDIRGIMCQVIAAVIVDHFRIDELNQIFAFFDLLHANTSIELQTVELSIVEELLQRFPAESHEALADFFFEILLVKCNSESHSEELLSLWSGSLFAFEFEQKKLPSEIHTMAELRNVICRQNKLIHRIVLSRSVPRSVDVIQRAVEAVFAKIGIPGQKSQLFRMCISDPCEAPEQRQRILSYLDSFYDSSVRPFLAGLLCRSSAFERGLLAGLRKYEQELVRIHEKKSGIVDPGLQELAIETAGEVCTTTAWRAILKHFVHEQALFNLPLFEWRRDFRFTPQFSCIQLKRSVRIPGRRQLSASEDYIKSFRCDEIKIGSRRSGVYFLYPNRIVLIFDRCCRQFLLSEIRECFVRQRLQKPTGVEFILKTGKSILLDFCPIPSIDVVTSLTEQKIPCPNLNPDWTGTLIKRWRSNLFSNYDFLLRLNLFSGRSFRDDENYIVFPWVAFSPDEFRDLQFPIAARTASRRKELLRLLQLNKTNPDGPYAFGAAPSNGTSLGFFFVRLQPFTSLHLRTHDGKFDCENRMFTSLTQFFNGIEGNGECREASPEFFSMPEVLLSLADECLVKDVKLPPWAATAPDFVYWNRKMLESQRVSNHLHEWVDLMFGVAQSAEDKCNVFLPYLYDDIWKRTHQPELVVMMLTSLGSMPLRVFDEPVPAKPPAEFRKLQVLHFKFECEPIVEAVCAAKSRTRIQFFVRTAAGTIKHFFRSFGVDQEKLSNEYPLRLARNSRMILRANTLHVFDFPSNRTYVISDTDELIFKGDVAFPANLVWEHHGNSLFCVSRDGVLKAFALENFDQPRKMTQFLTQSVRCFAVSQEFGVVALGTNDGFIEVYSLERQQLVKAHPLDFCVASRILITATLGLMLVLTDGHVWLFTVNGFFIKRERFPIRVTEWLTWREPERFDVIGCVDGDGRIFAFEAYYPDRVEIIGAVGHTVVGIGYEPRLRAVVAVTEDAVLHVFPVGDA